MEFDAGCVTTAGRVLSLAPSILLSRRRDETMKKIFLSLLALVILTFILTGCGQTAIPEFTQTQNSITAVFSMSPDLPAAMVPVTLSLKLTDASGKAIEGAQVAYDLTMPGMTMPPNQPQTTDKGRGVYQADAAFTMSGDWRVEAAVTYNSEIIPFTFDFSVK
jgi:hypothetical protein